MINFSIHPSFHLSIYLCILFYSILSIYRRTNARVGTHGQPHLTCSKTVITCSQSWLSPCGYSDSAVGSFAAIVNICGLVASHPAFLASIVGNSGVTKTPPAIRTIHALKYQSVQSQYTFTVFPVENSRSNTTPRSKPASVLHQLSSPETLNTLSRRRLGLRSQVSSWIRHTRIDQC